jgi:hypothetical protein
MNPQCRYKYIKADLQFLNLFEYRYYPKKLT